MYHINVIHCDQVNFQITLDIAPIKEANLVTKHDAQPNMDLYFHDYGVLFLCLSSLDIAVDFKGNLFLQQDLSQWQKLSDQFDIGVFSL